MKQTFTSVPFKSENHHGLTSVNGIAKFSSAGIVLEFESKLFGLVSDGVKEARLPIADLLDVRFKKGIWKRGAKIDIRLKSFSQLSEIPNSEGKITLKLRPEDFERARDAVEQLNKDIAEQVAGLPPPHVPLRSLFDTSEDETKELEGSD
ncbi:MAG: hypothetical protein WBO10_03560 [Pyrinomonadaceae bacterium]